ncbi:MAG: hypothetical protein H7251_05565 [Acetobacteraceae bacterium]|nr:hypothetical protein [Acetobacteraceae bacterium]
MRKFVVFLWNYVFDHRVSPLRHIPDIATRHMILQVLAWMWVLSFSVAIGSYTMLAANLVGHAVLIAAATITVATYTVAASKPQIFATGLGRSRGGEHE